MCLLLHALTQFHLCLLLQALTQFYLLLLHPSKLQCINRVNGKVRQELPLAPPRSLAQAGPSALALASDDAEGTIYILSGRSLATGLGHTTLSCIVEQYDLKALQPSMCW